MADFFTEDVIFVEFSVYDQPVLGFLLMLC